MQGTLFKYNDTKKAARYNERFHYLRANQPFTKSKLEINHS